MLNIIPDNSMDISTDNFPIHSTLSTECSFFTRIKDPSRICFFLDHAAHTLYPEKKISEGLSGSIIQCSWTQIISKVCCDRKVLNKVNLWALSIPWAFIWQKFKYWVWAGNWAGCLTGEKKKNFYQKLMRTVARYL